jgi:pyrroloquinoline quinone (PQQ) biosynthesis protein C
VTTHPAADQGNDRLLTPNELEAQLRGIGAERYHHLHPFHKRLHGGELTRSQVQAWALNRYYYQAMIPIKDAHALSKLPTSELRRDTRFAVEAYVNFVRDRPILEGIASSLTEMFSPAIIADRVRGMLANYSFITKDTLAYFTPRLTQAPQDVDFALSYVKAEATTRADQEAVLAALRFKCDVLWTQLDALYLAYVEPGMIPPGAFVPK